MHSYPLGPLHLDLFIASVTMTVTSLPRQSRIPELLPIGDASATCLLRRTQARVQRPSFFGEFRGPLGKLRCAVEIRAPKRPEKVPVHRGITPRATAASSFRNSFPSLCRPSFFLIFLEIDNAVVILSERSESKDPTLIF